MSSEIILRALESNIIIEEKSFIKIEFLNDDELKKKLLYFSSKKIIAVFTSSNAVKAVVNHLGHVSWKIYCVGQTTKKLLVESFGSDSIFFNAQDAFSLAKKIIEDNIKEVIFFCGDHRRDELPGMLSAQGIGVEEIMVYRTILTPCKVPGVYDGILFFSPSAVESYFSMNKLNPQTKFFAIGNTTANAIKKYYSPEVIVSLQTGVNEVIQMVIDYYKNLQNVCNN